MTTGQLRLSLTIARHRSLSRAAAELDLGQATVSERLKALEGEVGTPLFERRGVTDKQRKRLRHLPEAFLF